MTTEQIRNLTTAELRNMVNGLTNADRISRLVAQNEIDRRRLNA